MTKRAGVVLAWGVTLLWSCVGVARAAECEPLQFGPSEFSISAWSENEWRLLPHDDCLRPRKLFAWPGTERAYVNGHENTPLQSDRPTFTQANTVVGLRRVQVESGYTYIRISDNGPLRTANSVPETLLRVGVLAEWCEFRVGWSSGTNSPRAIRPPASSAAPTNSTWELSSH